MPPQRESAAPERPPAPHELHPPSLDGYSYHHTRASLGWERLPKEDYIRRVVARGHRLPFKRRFTPKGFHQPCTGRIDQQYVMERVVEASRKLHSGAYVMPPTQDALDLVSRGHMITPTFMVDKIGTTRKRLVHNQKRSNVGIRKKGPKLEDSRVVEQLATPGGYMMTCDVGSEKLKGKDGYHMLMIAAEDQKYMTSDLGPSVAAASLLPPDREAILRQAGVDIAGMEPDEIRQYWGPVPRYVMCAALPYGYQNAPWLFQTAMTKIAKVLRSGELKDAEGNPVYARCSIYLDDWAFFPTSRRQGELWAPVIAKVFRDHGIMAQWGKGTVTADGTWEIVQMVESHIGVGVNLTGSGVFFVPPQRMARIRQQCRAVRKSYARNQGRVGALWVAQVTGLCVSTWQAVPQARFQTRPLFDDLVRSRAYNYKFRNQIRLSRESLRCLQWWEQLSSSPEVGRTIHYPPVNLPWTCDACTTQGQGWGAALPSQPLTGNPEQQLGLPAAGIWKPKHRGLSINALELKAVKKALRVYRRYPKSGDWSRPGGWVSLIRGRSLLLWEDNTTVVAQLNRYSARDLAAREDLHKIMTILEEEEAIQRCRWVESAKNPADYFSRVPSKGEWILRQEVVDGWIAQMGQPCTVDRFADHLSARLPRFNAPYPCKGCEAVDCFTVSWIDECSWINPPWRLLGRIVLRLQQEPGAAAVLLVPRWPTQHWWPGLAAMAAKRLDVRVRPADVSTTGLAAQMGVTPEILRRGGRSDHMSLFYVPARMPDVVG